VLEPDDIEPPLEAVQAYVKPTVVPAVLVDPEPFNVIVGVVQLICAGVATTAVGVVTSTVTVIASVSVHPFASVAVTVYVPDILEVVKLTVAPLMVPDGVFQE
jgi:hypothetical protein